MIDSTALTVIEGDARIADTHLQQVLGYARIADLHALIRKHEAELSVYGEVFRRSAGKPPMGSVDSRSILCRSGKEPFGGSDEVFRRSGKARGGRPTLTYYVNEAQATLICMFSRTERAALARKIVIDVFTAWRRGELEGVAAPKSDPFAAMAGRAGHTMDHLQAIAAMPALARNATHLPIWPNGQRPRWWGD